MCSGSEQRAIQSWRRGGAPVHRVPADIDGIVATKATRLGISLGNPNPNPRVPRLGQVDRARAMPPRVPLRSARARVTDDTPSPRVHLSRVASERAKG